MKAMSSLVIALLAIFSVFASANISPLSFNMIANVSQLSVATSEFVDLTNDDAGGIQAQIAFFFIGHYPRDSPAYTKLDCTTAISLGNPSNFAIKRLTVERSDDPSGFTRVDHNLLFNDGNVVGRFKTACSFIAPEFAQPIGSPAFASVAIGAKTAKITEYTTQIRPFKGVVGGFAAYVSPTYSMSKPTVFRIVNINRSSTPNKQFIIRNPHASEATTGCLINFESSSSQTFCDVYWDNVLYKNSASTEIVEHGIGVRITLGSPLNSANEILLNCYDVRGIAIASPGFYGDAAKYFPSSLEFDYESYKAFTVASTPSYPSSVEFETGFTANTPFPHFTPMSPISHLE